MYCAICRSFIGSGKYKVAKVSVSFLAASTVAHGQNGKHSYFSVKNPPLPCSDHTRFTYNMCNNYKFAVVACVPSTFSPAFSIPAKAPVVNPFKSCTFVSSANPQIFHGCSSPSTNMVCNTTYSVTIFSHSGSHSTSSHSNLQNSFPPLVPRLRSRELLSCPRFSRCKLTIFTTAWRIPTSLPLIFTGSGAAR